MKKIAFMLLTYAVASSAMAAGEILSLQTRGTQYCPGKVPIHFTPSNDRPLFVKFNDNGTLSAYLDAVKATPDFIVNIDGDQIATRTYAYHADYLEDSYNHLSVVGKIKFDKFGLVKTMAGTIIRIGLIDNCYAVGKLTGKRIN